MKNHLNYCFLLFALVLLNPLLPPSSVNNSNSNNGVDAFSFPSVVALARRRSFNSNCPFSLLRDDLHNYCQTETETQEQSTPISTVPAPLTQAVASRKQFISDLIMSSMSITTSTFALTSSSQPAMATYIDPKTKINFPFIHEIEEAIPSNWDDIDNPFISSSTSKTDIITESSSELFDRLDNTNDFIFYTEPRFVEHVDKNAVSILQDYIQKSILKPNMDVLDLCSSWTSHITPQTKEQLTLKRVAGLGMNELELKRNEVLTEYTVMNLNERKGRGDTGSSGIRMPYDDSSFDVVLCQLSIDYLIYPLEVMKEVGRVLKKGGQIVILFSNRLFLQKAVGLWAGADDIDHAFIVGSYLYYCNGGFVPSSIQAKDLSIRNKKGMIIGDPVYVVTSRKD